MAQGRNCIGLHKYEETAPELVGISVAVATRSTSSLLHLRFTSRLKSSQVVESLTGMRELIFVPIVHEAVETPSTIDTHKENTFVDHYSEIPFFFFLNNTCYSIDELTIIQSIPANMFVFSNQAERKMILALQGCEQSV